MAKEVTIKIDQSAGQIAIADGTLFLGENAPIKFTGCTLAKGESIRLVLFAKDGTTAIADNSTDSSLLDLRTELVKKAFHSEQVDHAFLAYAFTINAAGTRTGTMDARGVLPVAWSPAIMTSQGTIGLYKGDKGDRGDHGGVDPCAVAREFSLSDTYSINEIVFTYRNNDDTTQIVFYTPIRTFNGTITGIPVTDEKYWAEFPLSGVYVLLAYYDQVLLDSFPSTDPLYIYDTVINGATILQWFDLTGNEVNQETYGNGDWYDVIYLMVGDTAASIKEHLDSTSNPHAVTLEQIGGATTNEINALIAGLGDVLTVNYAEPEEYGNITLVANADTYLANVYALPIQEDVVTDTVYNIPPINIPQISFGELDMYAVNGDKHILGISTRTKDTINFETTAEDGTKIVSTLEPSGMQSDFILTKLDLEIVHLFMTKEDLARLQDRIASLNETLESVA